MPRKLKEPPFSKAEIAFFEAIDRLLEGKPINSALRNRSGLKINMTTIAIEAGYARTYLYKCNLPRVMARIEDVTKPHKEMASKKNLIDELRAQRNQAWAERDKAIDGTRKWMQQCFRLERTIKDLQREIANMEEAARRRPSPLDVMK